MRNLILIFSLLICIQLFSANFLLNSDFELWSDSIHPNSWYQDSTYRDSFRCVQSSVKYSGSYSFTAHVFTRVQALTDVLSEYVAVQPSTAYRIKAHILDNDPAVYGKLYLNYYDASYIYLGNNFALDSVGDNSSWQAFPETLISTPATAYFAKVGFRFYDTSLWDGNGEIFIDSVYFGDTLGGSSVNTPQFSLLTHTPASPVNLQKLTVSCVITDNGSVTADSLFYKVNSDAWVKVYRDSLIGNTRYYSIPGQTASSAVLYYVWAKDNENLTSVSDTNSYTVSYPSQTKIKKVLFDYTKNQTAGNADWIIDANYPVPLPANPSYEDDWYGGISSWGFELDTAHIYNANTSYDTIEFEVFTLPPDSQITYGTTRPMDLKNYDVYIVCEPQNPFTSAESTAIFNYVANGGGLFMVADHVSSDRDGDGWDSPQVWDNFGSDAFGMHFYQVSEGNNNISDYTSTYNTSNDTIVNGPFGSVIGGTYNFHAGTMIQQSASALEVALYNTSYSMLSVAFYGSHNGRVAGTGDSSPCDDSTGNTSDELYDGWNEGIDRRLLLNTTYWLSVDSLDYTQTSAVDSRISSEENRVSISINISDYSKYSSIKIFRKLMCEFSFSLVRECNSASRISIEDALPSYYKGTVTYRIMGSMPGESVELALFDVSVKRETALSASFFTSSDYLNISGVDNERFYITDITGRKIKEGIINNNRINLKGINSGIYFLRFEKHSETGRIVKIK
ncbi:TPA: hypothetical protein DCW38_02845 [candidate division WOR-3 bacterium]|uniref:T9SS type A sorting domain-containing protein n=1 Tax=candidate division WOR-3 bacterium TaxID=2052148 RepID=A0A350H984_UNCW3|nr:hypothetical protein [candidate division WOR-3 bacterium]